MRTVLFFFFVIFATSSWDSAHDRRLVVAVELRSHQHFLAGSSSAKSRTGGATLNENNDYFHFFFGTEESPQRRLVSCEDLDYENKDDSYSPSDLVRNGHRLSNEEFCPEQAYYSKVSVAPIVLTSLYLLMFLLFFIGMCCRCCIEWCQCRPDSNSSSFRSDKLWNTVAFFAFSLIAIAFSLLILLSNFRLDSGMRTISSSSADVEDILRDCRTEGRRLDSYGSSLSSSLTSARTSCDGASESLLDDIEESIDNFNEGATEFVDQMDPAIDALRGFNGAIDLYSGFYRQLAIYITFSLSIFFVLCMLTMKMLKSVCGMQLFITLGLLLFLFYTALLLPFTAAASLLGDFCMDPSRSAVNAAPKSDSAQDLAIYYSTCAGNSTFADDLYACRVGVNFLNSSLTELQQSCPGDGNVESMLDTVDRADGVLDGIEELVECEPLQDEWFSLFNDGFCGDFYDGIFYLWLGILLAGFFVLVLAITASFTYNYFDAVDIPIVITKKKKNAHPSSVAPGDGSDEDEAEAEEDAAYAQHEGKRRSQRHRHHAAGESAGAYGDAHDGGGGDDDDDFDVPPFEEADSSQIDVDTSVHEEHVAEVERKRRRSR